MIKIYNTLSRRKEILKPRKGKKINIFVCGPTVYDSAHLGHARTYLAFDAIVKYLRQKGYDVFYLQNITDIDDKIIQRAREQGKTPKVLATQFEKEYLKDMRALEITSVSKYARATDYVKEIISQTERLLKRGYAYQIEDGIYYDISKFKNYGKLSGRTVLQAEDAVSRIDETAGKKNKGDFCLWKFIPSAGSGQTSPERRWRSPWGWGRPGWHIEDTAIAEKFFGPQYDMHGGAQDLMFPHHEAEISQMEAVSQKTPFVKYWLHTGFLTIEGQKMAKSLNNFITIRAFLEGAQPHSKRSLRLMVLKSHYRSPLDYRGRLIAEVNRELERIDEFMVKLNKLKTGKQNREAKLDVLRFQKNFERAMEDDFNTPKVVAVIFDLINNGNILMAQDKLSAADAARVKNFLRTVDDIFGFIFSEKKQEKIPSEIGKLSQERENYRQQNNWQKADEIRDEITKMGWRIEDTPSGPKFKKI